MQRNKKKRTQDRENGEKFRKNQTKESRKINKA